MKGAIEIPGIDLDCRGGILPPECGAEAFAALLRMGAAGLEKLTERVGSVAGCHSRVVVGRIRGRRPGVSFGAVVGAVESAFPRPMQSPFEGTHSVAGAAWEGAALLGPTETMGMLKLCFAPGTDDLPMHSHEDSDRFIVVLEGRGFFHASQESVASFTGADIQTIAVRERDVLMFRRGAVHTFSTTDHLLVLLSIHRPFIPLDQPEQYTLPARRCFPGKAPMPSSGKAIGCDWAWTVIA